jgi:hypothetical protein
MRDQMERELTRKGKLPVGVSLDVVKRYVEMTGQGEIWVNAAGRPLRQVLRLAFPPADLERVEVEITTDFSGWDKRAETPPTWLGFTRLTPRALAQAGQMLGLALGLLGVLGLVFRYRRSPVVYAAIVLTVIASMLLTPLLQSQQAYAFSEDQRAQQSQAEADRAARQQAREAQAELTGKAFDPHRDPLSVTLAQTTTIPEAGQLIPSLETWGWPCQLAGPRTSRRSLRRNLRRNLRYSMRQTILRPTPAAWIPARADGDGLTNWQECRRALIKQARYRRRWPE